MGAVIRPRGRVLVVDDDAVICELVATTLAEHGYPTRRASDAREAIYLVQRETPDVVLLDVHLPDISGYQVCRRLRDDYGESIGIILISGERRESMDRAAGLLLGADDYMVKPFVLDELLARVRSLACRVSVFREGTRHEIADNGIVVDNKHSTARPYDRSHFERGLTSKNRTQTD